MTTSTASQVVGLLDEGPLLVEGPGRPEPRRIEHAHRVNGAAEGAAYAWLLGLTEPVPPGFVFLVDQDRLWGPFAPWEPLTAEPSSHA